MISFDNTEIAFKSKSNRDLNKSYFLFNVIKRPSIVKIGSILTEFAFNFRLPINGIVKATIFKQFCGGENIEECTETINKLSDFGIGAILDYSVEGKENESEFEKTKNETLNTLKKATQSANIPFCVFKVTGLSRFALLEQISANKELSENEKIEKNKIWERVDSICKSAFENSVPIFIDAEESWIQPAIDELAETMMEKYNLKSAIVYNTFQLYRKDRLDYLISSIEEANKKKYFLGAKLVRGAYMEKERDRAQKLNYPSPINPSKEATDAMYDNALNHCLENINTVSICAGTHNEKSSLALVELMEKKSISKNDKRIYFSQLFGMSEHISFNLAKEGYNVAKYLPYGPVQDVLPYLIRRAQENTSVEGQTGRELGLIIKEKERRSKK
ncbi:MAG: proline dehydrogenase family protein [Bacteroidia bacterium]|jgi:proline dehydrogenase